MAIPVEEVQALKARLDLVSVVQQHGITLKRKGKDYVGLCPFHQERTPSFTVNPRKQLYHCFGCPPDGKQGGDVIRFVSRVKSLGFRETLETLGADLPPRQGPPPGHVASSIDRKECSAPKSTAPAAAIKEEIDPARAPANASGDDDAPARCPQKLLERVASFYEGTFADEPAGRQYLHARGLSDPDALKIFRAGFAAPGKLLKALPDEGDLIDQLKAIGVLTARGRELFADCVVF
ncbi:MAG: hypothetical protein GY944_23435, partial [bacterium]|nr:hypothetical protein [bacterium]